MPDIKLYNGDCLEVLKNIADNSINCVITSPPYNVDLGNNKYNKNKYNSYDDNKEHQEYLLWLEDIFRIIKDKLVDGGRVCINIGDGKNGAVPTHSDIIQFMINKLNYTIITTIIWNKSQIGARTAWGSFMSPSCPSYPCPFEYILIFSKGSIKLQHKGESDLTKEEFINNAFGLWTFSPEQKMKEIGHPAAFPIELPQRLIKMNTYIGDTVLDPFMGSGTTGVASVNGNRNFVGIEIDEEYFKLSKHRIELVRDFNCVSNTFNKPNDSVGRKKLF